MNTPSELALAAGTKVDEYTLEQVLGGGGFSIVYLGRSRANQQVVIKEYLPSSLATRAPDQTVVCRDSQNNERFTHGRRLFFQEANTLTTLKHPNIVNVINFFRANDTVYMVMEYEEGVNLQTYIKKHKGSLSEPFIKAVFLPLLDGVKLIHSQGLLHLDIKPSNIHLRAGANPLLLDFGAVHEIMQTRQFQPNQVVTPGFSPIEQLDPGGYVGPWTDLYAMGATMRASIEGNAPPPSPKRREKDLLKSAASAFKKRYSSHLLGAIDWAMEVDPLLRPQNVDQLLEAINGNSPRQDKKRLFNF
ncbi:MAG: serine/threonine protein kinase [Gammaproteobacteria bacterium]|nr:serine/threonine protein kinase [Gammaproteobacteria bacterium]